MQVAEILSDLTSLRVCDHGAALALVSSHKALSSISEASRKNHGADPLAEKESSRLDTTLSVFSLTGEKSVDAMEEDPDLQRATDLVNLHYGVKEKHVQGVNMGLSQARIQVNRVVEKLKAKYIS